MVVRVFTVRRTLGIEILVLVLDEPKHLQAEGNQLSANLGNLVYRELERLEEAEVLGDRPNGLLPVQSSQLILVPGQKLPGRVEVLCDGLLRQNMLPRLESLLDHIWLVQDGQGDNHGSDVSAAEEVIKRFASGGRAIEVNVYILSGR